MASDAERQGLIEVLEVRDRAYFVAELLDVDGDYFSIRYMGEELPVLVESSRARPFNKPMTEEERQRFEAASGQVVEVSFPADDEGNQSFESWWEGKVVKQKGEFFFVEFPEEGEVHQEVVEKERLRPAYGHQPVKVSKKTFPIAPELQADVRATQDSLPKIAKHAGLFVLRLSADGKELIALGPNSAMETANMLINMHFVKVPQLAKVAQKASTLQSKMSDSSAASARGTSIVFKVDSQYIGVMIGPRGSHVRRVQGMNGIIRVDIRNDGTVTIVADTQAQAEAAREALEVQTESLPIQDKDVGWIIGKGGKTIHELQQLSECRLNVVHQPTPRVELTGLRSTIEKARALIMYTLETGREQREKEAMIQQMSGELFNLGIMSNAPRRGRARADDRNGGVSMNEDQEQQHQHRQHQGHWGAAGATLPKGAGLPRGGGRIAAQRPEKGRAGDQLAAGSRGRGDGAMQGAMGGDMHRRDRDLDAAQRGKGQERDGSKAAGSGQVQGAEARTGGQQRHVGGKAGNGEGAQAQHQQNAGYSQNGGGVPAAAGASGLLPTPGRGGVRSAAGGGGMGDRGGRAGASGGGGGGGGGRSGDGSGAGNGKGAPAALQGGNSHANNVQHLQNSRGAAQADEGKAKEGAAPAQAEKGKGDTQKKKKQAGQVQEKQQQQQQQQQQSGTGVEETVANGASDGAGGLPQRDRRGGRKGGGRSGGDQP